MPIEIKITNPHALTERDINTLHVYLLACINPEVNIQAYSNDKPIAVPLPAQVIITPKKPHFSEVTFTEEQLMEAYKDNPGTITFMDEGLHGVDIERKDLKPKKPRKKRTVKEPIGKTHRLEISELEGDSFISGEPATNVGRGNRHTVILEDEHKLPEVTYDELIAFILENTREKKLQIDDYMQLMVKFEIPNLQQLKELPHLIQPFYIALKEFVDE